MEQPKSSNQRSVDRVDRNKITDHGTRSMGRRFEFKGYIPPKFYSRIIGSKGSTKRQLEEETKTSIVVPRMGSNSKYVIIRGDTEEDVRNAKERLDQITNAQARPPKQKFTHFLSASFATDEIKSNYLRFKDEVMSDPETRHLHESVFPAPEKLHVTIVMLVLAKEGDEVIANECLEECKESIIDKALQGDPLTVKVSGVETFADCKPSAVNVVFGRVESEPLQKIADEMSRFFESRGLLRLERANAKLHLTLINTLLYQDVTRAEESEDDRERAFQMKRKTFDATRLIAKYKDFYFGSVTIDEIHISILGGEETENGYYQSAGVLKL